MSAVEKADSGNLKITQELRSLLGLALQEDVGSGDVTSIATVPPHQWGKGRVFAREEGVICGIDVARAVMELVDRRIRMVSHLEDGDRLQPDRDILTCTGPLRSILTGERVMLNFLQHLSGVATLTRRFVDALRQAGSGMEVVDTRKTTPLWRALEKHAVVAGGGRNHRFALYDMYLIKNNHVDAAGGVRQALEAAHRDNETRGLQIAVEARNLEEVREILEIGADLILLDNMTPAQVRRAADLINGRIATELTGGVTLGRIASLATLPVDRVSIGALTHSAPALDIALHLECSFE